MKRLKLLAALLALTIGLAGCGKGSSASSSKPEKMLDGDNMIASPSAKQEYTEPEDVTYMRLLAGEDEYRACVLYLGGSYEITTDVQKVLDSQQGLRELWGFVYDIPQDHWVISPDGGCDLYCIFPQDPDATLFVYETSLTDDAENPLQRGKQRLPASLRLLPRIVHPVRVVFRKNRALLGNKCVKKLRARLVRRLFDALNSLGNRFRLLLQFLIGQPRGKARRGQ